MEKTGQGYVLKADPKAKVSARAHKMSKSRGNVVNPDDIVFSYGADSLRLYEMFMGPLRETKVLPFFRTARCPSISCPFSRSLSLCILPVSGIFAVD